MGKKSDYQGDYGKKEPSRHSKAMRDNIKRKEKGNKGNRNFNTEDDNEW